VFLFTIFHHCDTVRLFLKGASPSIYVSNRPTRLFTAGGSFTDCIDMDLSKLLNPVLGDQADPSAMQFRHASEAGSSNDGHSLSRPNLDPPRPRRRYAPILPASVSSTPDANINNPNSATTSNQPGTLAGGSTSRTWTEVLRPKRKRECLAYGTRKRLHSLFQNSSICELGGKTSHSSSQDDQQDGRLAHPLSLRVPQYLWRECRSVRMVRGKTPHRQRNSLSCLSFT
jgi:hypothetical protein